MASILLAGKRSSLTAVSNSAAPSVVCEEVCQSDAKKGIKKVDHDLHNHERERERFPGRRQAANKVSQFGKIEKLANIIPNHILQNIGFFSVFNCKKYPLQKALKFREKLKSFPNRLIILHIYTIQICREW